MAWSDVQQVIRDARAQLDDRQAELWERLVDSYGLSYSQLLTDLDILLDEYGDGEGVTEAEVRSSHNFLALLSLWMLGMGGFVTLASWEIRSEQSLAVIQGGTDALEMIRGTLPRGTTDDMLAALGLSLNRLPDVKTRDILYRLQLRRPLEDLLRDAAGNSFTGIGDVLAKGIREGWTRKQIAEELRRTTGMALTRALRITNTEIHHSYTDAQAATFDANPDLVEAQVRRCRRDGRACIACLMLDGKVYKRGASMDDHTSGRCFFVPRLFSAKELGLDGRNSEGPQTTGREWFEQQDEEMQRGILGKGMYDAWQSGKVNLEDIPHQVHDDVWGDSWIPRSLKDLLG